MHVNYINFDLIKKFFLSNIMGTCNGKPLNDTIPNINQKIEYEPDECPICYEKMMKNPWATSDQKFNCQQCNKLFHNNCWCRCINIDGKCPWCRETIVPDRHMETIRFCQARNHLNGNNEEHHLCATYIFSLELHEIGDDGKTTICYSYE